MSLLVDPAPVSVTAAGGEWPIRTDYRIGILFEQLMLDASLSDQEKFLLVLKLYYPAGHPPDFAAAGNAMLWFYRCGKPAPKQHAGQGGRTVKVFDYDQDDGYIYAAFLQQYGIDLEAVEELHWWKFKALFNSLPSDCMICKIMEWRATDTSKLKGAQKEHILRMQRLYALQRPKEEQEKYEAIAAALMGTGDLSAL